MACWKVRKGGVEEAPPLAADTAAGVSPSAAAEEDTGRGRGREGNRGGGGASEEGE
jgi:hypothetical protein